MPERKLRIVKRQSPDSIGVCEGCNQQFTSHLPQADKAEWEISTLFSRHKCKPASLRTPAKPLPGSSERLPISKLCTCFNNREGSVTYLGMQKRTKRQRWPDYEIVHERAQQPMPDEPTPIELSRVMAALGRKGGRVGGKRRLETMTPERRKEIASKAAKARWRARER